MAKLTAEANIAKAQGDAQAVQVRAQAEANAIKLKSLEIARMMGFDVVVDKENSTEEETVYVIDFTGKTRKKSKLYPTISNMSNILKYGTANCPRLWAETPPT